MLSAKILKLYPTLTKEDFGRFGTIRLRDYGQGPYIAKWEHSTLPRPTQAQLDAITVDINEPLPQPLSLADEIAALKARIAELESR